MKVRYFSTLFLILFISLLSFGGANAATITVTERTDSFATGNCSLRDAVEMVNTGGTALGTGCSFTGSFGDVDTINLEGGAPYVVSLPDMIGGNQDGDIDINEDLIIQGLGMDVTVVTGGFPLNEETRIFNVCESCNELKSVLMTDLTISNGGSLSEDGGGIHIEFNGFLTLQFAHVRDNIGEDGGGIAVEDGILLMNQSMVTGNMADQNGGGIFYSGDINIPFDFTNGSALFINESTIDNNQATFGGGIDSEGDLFLIYNSTVSNNTARGEANGAGVGGAGVTVGDGGGIYIGSNFNITRLVNNTISTNTAHFNGGGVFIQNDSGIATDVGAAGFQQSGAFFFNNTLTLNQSGLEGGGIHFELVDIPASESEPAGGFFGAVVLANTIVAQNESPTGPDCFELLVSVGFNLFGTDANCIIVNNSGNPDKIDEDPLLGDLQDNGGPTFTHGLPSGSPAIDMGNNVTGCLAPDFQAIIDDFNFTEVDLIRDQRNFPRPIAVNDPNTPVCDIGAFEFQVFDFVVTKDDGLDGEEIPVGTTFDYTINVTNNGPGTATAVTLNDPIPTEMDFVSATSSQGSCAAIGQVLGCDLGDLAVGETATITVTVTATEAGSFTNVVTITLTNEFQEQLTETAQVTTVVTSGLFVFGSGVHCGLQPGAVQASPGFALMLGLMSVVIFGAALTLRRKSHG